VPFVSEGFDVPLALEGPGFVLEPLGPQHNERDHEAWMSSIDFIHTLPGFDGPDARWPTPMSLQENLGDLERHARDFAERNGFTYTVLDPASHDVIGCLYIYPSKDDRHDADVRSWVRASRPDLDRPLRAAIAAWLEDTWPFTDPSYRVG
jgi:hypothetical protein